MAQKQAFEGLTASQVVENREKYGVNILTPPAKEPLWKQFLDKFRDPLILVLLIAGLPTIVRLLLTRGIAKRITAPKLCLRRHG